MARTCRTAIKSAPFSPPPRPPSLKNFRPRARYRTILKHSPKIFLLRRGRPTARRAGYCRIRPQKKAYCFEGAVLAAAALAYHGRPPLLLDLQTTNDDQDHVLALFKEDGLWGAISKTNNPVLRWRDPVYRSVRELAMSYFHEYFLYKSGEKTLRAYSKAFDLSRFDPKEWVVARREPGLAGRGDGRLSPLPHRTEEGHGEAAPRLGARTKDFRFGGVAEKKI